MKNHNNFDRDYLYIETIYIHLLLYLDCIDMQKYTYLKKIKLLISVYRLFQSKLLNNKCLKGDLLELKLLTAIQFMINLITWRNIE